ncbi:ethanolamine ammonia-lyase reactivating factor EutA [Anaerotruncus rubiinfantis]|uniref:ethanolamine ammonia-lyase reactivating factor EutA n=1 Tax=Anaerotruncus rubiinfantis TaxID=1720200 RepID=UPI0011C7D259|nr:ethanolamine ammonia-lyase reactivating factor EutA [Anaerotruncus rubiinfantis]
MAAEQFLSVGIDIGTSTTQVVFSCLTVENKAGYFSAPRVSIVDKRVVYTGEIHRTPLLNSVRIDAQAVQRIVAGEFARAGYMPAQIGTGAVIITGESARKENARAVLEKLSNFAGEFVVSTAGPDLEAVIAGKGSGAWQYSVDNACAAVNIDIGGGTSNIVQFYDGRAVARGCVDIGGGQICFSPDGVLTYLSPSARAIADACGSALREGTRVDKAELCKVCEAMAELLFQLTAGERSVLLDRVRTAESSPFIPPYPTQAVFFSGGVARCFYENETEIEKYGDIGVILAKKLRKSRFCSEYRIVSGCETIRATVVGAGCYTTGISGSTIFYSAPLFPQKNLPVLKLSMREQDACFAGESATLVEQLGWFLAQTDGEKLLLALPGRSNPTYDALKRLAETIAVAVRQVYPLGAPVFLAVETDMAKALGQAVFAALQSARPVVSIDAVQVEQNDYIDLGRPLMDGLVIPVVVKTLIFG